jgi:hypothetical protein
MCGLTLGADLSMDSISLPRCLSMFDYVCSWQEINRQEIADDAPDPDKDNDEQTLDMLYRMLKCTLKRNERIIHYQDEKTTRE